MVKYKAGDITTTQYEFPAYVKARPSRTIGAFQGALGIMGFGLSPAGISRDAYCTVKNFAYKQDNIRAHIMVRYLSYCAGVPVGGTGCR